VVCIALSNEAEKIKKIFRQSAACSQDEGGPAPLGRSKAIGKVLDAFLRKKEPATESYKKLITIIRQELQVCVSAEELQQMKG
jgi:hypothetical protein